MGFIDGFLSIFQCKALGVTKLVIIIVVVVSSFGILGIIVINVFCILGLFCWLIGELCRAGLIIVEGRLFGFARFQGGG